MTATPQIIAYVREQIAHGFSTDAIRQVMMQSGYTDMQVKEAFQGAGIGAPEQPPVREPAPEPLPPVQSVATETPQTTIEPVVSTPAPAENAEVYPPAQKAEVQQPATMEHPQPTATMPPVSQPQGSFVPVRDIRPAASSEPSSQIIAQSIPRPSPTFPAAMPNQAPTRTMPPVRAQGPGTFRAAPGAGGVARASQRPMANKEKKGHLLSVLIALIFVLLAGGVFAHWYLIAKQPPIGQYVRAYIPIPENLPINLDFLNFFNKQSPTETEGDARSESSSTPENPSASFDDSGLPPDPGEAGKATLEGIDSDGDGVRDDVQRYIATSSPNSEKTRAALTQFAIEIQDSLLLANDREAAIKYWNTEKAHDCLLYIYNDDIDRAIDINRELHMKVLNTPERGRASFQFDSYLTAPKNEPRTQLYELDKLKSACNFDPDAMEN